MNYPNSIQNLIECFKKLPGIGEKTAERLSFSILNMDEDVTKFFSASMLDVKRKIKKCSICDTITEAEVCNICLDKDRDNGILCVVEDSKSVFLFENLGTFQGKYHVLGGLISPLDGVNPEDINLDKLIKRIETGNIKEIILALKPSMEGETTALYIVKLLNQTEVIVSKIAHGVPLGADMEYIDNLTLEMALEDRKKMS